MAVPAPPRTVEVTTWLETKQFRSRRGELTLTDNKQSMGLASAAGSNVGCTKFSGRRLARGGRRGASDCFASEQNSIAALQHSKPLS